MCQIIVCESNRAPVDLLQDSAGANRDGAGIAWIAEGRPRWRKGLSTPGVVALAGTVPLPYVVHFRMATVGGATPALTHPFPVTVRPSVALAGDAKRLLFHNGHVSEWEAILRASGYRGPSGGWSDSRAVAHVVATVGTNFLDLLSPSRFAILSKRGVEKWGTWHEHEGVEVSTHVWRTGALAWPSRGHGVVFDSAQAWLESRARVLGGDPPIPDWQLGRDYWTSDRERTVRLARIDAARERLDSIGGEK